MPVMRRGASAQRTHGLWCSRFREGCTLRLDFAQYPQDATPGRLRDMVERRIFKEADEVAVA